MTYVYLLGLYCRTSYFIFLTIGYGVIMLLFCLCAFSVNSVVTDATMLM